MRQTVRVAPGEALVFGHAIVWNAQLRRKARAGVRLEEFVQPRRPLFRLQLPTASVMHAVNAAYALASKQDRCLIVSVVAASALRAFAREDHSCEIVVAVLPKPFASHAWLEVAGQPAPLSEVLPGFRPLVRFSYSKDSRMAVPKSCTATGHLHGQ
jgi:hypothetical protein